MLTKDNLKRNLKKSFDRIFDGTVKVADPQTPPLPLMAKEVALELASAYDAWVESSSPLAGGLTIVTRGSKILIASQLILVPLMAGWATGLTLYWTATTWGNNPGFIPVNPTVPASLIGIAPEMAAFIVSGGGDTDAMADKIATILHKYTMQLVVSATTVAGATSLVPVT
jgi:hypothetical protein